MFKLLCVTNRKLCRGDFLARIERIAACGVAGIVLREKDTVAFTRQSDVDYYTKGKGGKRSDLLKRVELINNSDADFFHQYPLQRFR